MTALDMIEVAVCSALLRDFILASLRLVPTCARSFWVWTKRAPSLIVALPEVRCRIGSLTYHAWRKGICPSELARRMGYRGVVAYWRAAWETGLGARENPSLRLDS
jgi:hypothetical protein